MRVVPRILAEVPVEDVRQSGSVETFENIRPGIQKMYSGIFLCTKEKSRRQKERIW